jgi:hypothetical protein
MKINNKIVISIDLRASCDSDMCHVSTPSISSVCWDQIHG